MTDARATYEVAVELADEVLAHAREVFPELTFELNTYPGWGDDWSACSDEPYGGETPPRSFKWHPTRHTEVLQADPPGTVQLIMPIAQAYLDGGWEIGRDNLDQDHPTLTIHHDGFAIRFIARNRNAAPNIVNRLDFFISGPCQYSPDDLMDFDPAHPGDYFDDR
ncbi:hypothetical protein [Cellulomonas denverensis]|uniref:hypothetical protein n=1 Tax=Cellulomonas denverensis TaxID=264297 RepID=UPI0035EE0399